MVVPYCIGFSSGLELLDPELADALKHPEPNRFRSGRHAPGQALVDQGAEDLQNVQPELACRFGHSLGRLQGPAASERRQSAEEQTLRLAQELIAPLDRPAQGSLASGQVHWTAGEQ